MLGELGRVFGGRPGLRRFGLRNQGPLLREVDGWWISLLWLIVVNEAERWGVIGLAPGGQTATTDAFAIVTPNSRFWCKSRDHVNQFVCVREVVGLNHQENRRNTIANSNKFEHRGQSVMGIDTDVEFDLPPTENTHQRDRNRADLLNVRPGAPVGQQNAPGARRSIPRNRY